jgi:hypothetical protein
VFYARSFFRKLWRFVNGVQREDLNPSFTTGATGIRTSLNLSVTIIPTSNQPILIDSVMFSPVPYEYSEWSMY